MVSLVDWAMLTWSLGLTRYWPSSPPRIWVARLAITSLTFMLWLVPAPAWNGSTTNWSSQAPSITSSAAWTMAPARLASSRPRSRLTSAAARLMAAIDQINARQGRNPEMGKFKAARRVCTPYKASWGTCMSPSESRSVR